MRCQSDSTVCPPLWVLFFVSRAHKESPSVRFCLYPRTILTLRAHALTRSKRKPQTGYPLELRKTACTERGRSLIDIDSTPVMRLFFCQRLKQKRREDERGGGYVFFVTGSSKAHQGASLRVKRSPSRPAGPRRKRSVLPSGFCPPSVTVPQTVLTLLTVPAGGRWTGVWWVPAINVDFARFCTHTSFPRRGHSLVNGGPNAPGPYILLSPHRK